MRAEQFQRGVCIILKAHRNNKLKKKKKKTHVDNSSTPRRLSTFDLVLYRFDTHMENNILGYLHNNVSYYFEKYI